VISKTFLAIGSALFAAAAFAQAPIGKVESVNGIVTVTDGARGGTAASGNAITSGMRFVTTSGGSAVLRLNNGCVVNLKPNQSVTVDQGMSCDQLLASVQTRSVDLAQGSMQTGALSVAGLSTGALALNKAIPQPKSLSVR
jgi:hypothetical protein